MQQRAERLFHGVTYNSGDVVAAELARDPVATATAVDNNDITVLRHAMDVGNVTIVRSILDALEAHPDDLKAVVNRPDHKGLTFVHALLTSSDVVFAAETVSRLGKLIDWTHQTSGLGYVAVMADTRRWRIVDAEPILHAIVNVDPGALSYAFGQQSHLLGAVVRAKYSNPDVVTLEDVKAVLRLQPLLVDMPLGDSRTVAYLAVVNNDLPLLNVLLDAGANAAHVMMGNYSSLFIQACRVGNPAIVRLLLTRGADSNVRDRFNAPGVNYLVAFHPGFSPPLVRLLMQRLDDVNEPDVDGTTLLHLVAAQSEPEVYYAGLVGKNPDVTLKDKLGRTPRQVLVNNLRHRDPAHLNTRLHVFLRAIKAACRATRGCKKTRRFVQRLCLDFDGARLQDGMLSGYVSRNIDSIAMLLILTHKLPQLAIPVDCSGRFNDGEESLRLVSPIFAPSMVVWSEDGQHVASASLGSAVENALRSRALVAVHVQVLENNQSAHANIVLIDGKSKRCILFEPWGVPPPGTTRAACHDDVMGVFRRVPRLKGFDFQLPRHYYTNAGFQTLSLEKDEAVLGDPGGFCAAWCVWFVHCYAVNHKRAKTVKELVRRAIEHLLTDRKRTVLEYIREYASYLTLKKIQLLSERGIDLKSLRSAMPTVAGHAAVVLALTEGLC